MSSTRLQDAITGCRTGLGFAADPGVESVKITVSESLTVRRGQVAVIIDWATVGRCLFEVGLRGDGAFDSQAVPAAMDQILAGIANAELSAGTAAHEGEQ